MTRESLRRTGVKVAVVGSGPGGMACADELAKLGYAVTIFESQTRPGGLLVNGIPSFKLEKNIVERRFDLLRRRGVTVRCGVTVGRDIPLSSLARKIRCHLSRDWCAETERSSIFPAPI